MKLGIIGAPEAQSLLHAKELGLDFVEFDCNYGLYGGNRPIADIARNQDSIKKASEETGVGVGAIGRWSSHILDAQGEIIPAEWNEVKALIDFGAALGSKNYLCSVSWVPELTYYKNVTAAIKVLREIVAYAADKGMQTSIVNCMMGGNYIRTPELWRLVLPEVPGLGIKYDPSHSFVHGGQNGRYIEEALEFGKDIKYVHIKGVIQRGDSREPQEWAMRDLTYAVPEAEAYVNANRLPDNAYDNPPAGLDCINWRAFFGVLYKYFYDGCLSIEPHSSTWRGEKGELGVKYTIKYIRDLMILD